MNLNKEFAMFWNTFGFISRDYKEAPINTLIVVSSVNEKEDDQKWHSFIQNIKNYIHLKMSKICEDI